MYQTSEFRKGLKIEVDGKPYVIVDFLHVKPGKGGAFIRTKLKNLLTGQVIEPTFRSGEKVGKPDVEEKDMQYLYKEGDHYCFMDNATYEQVEIPESAVGEAKGFMLE
ncbi:MAG: elongation factor P, partial [Deltaproteobacteria bacterium]|nr:elongation factor P [Deltaproteobacteria bacterium]